ncbi:MAG: VOC family protein [Acidobacteriota bacterium]
MPPKPSRAEAFGAKLIKLRWFRKRLVSRADIPADVRTRYARPTEKNEGQKAFVRGTKNACLYVTDLDRSQEFFEKTVGLKHLATGELVDHPYKEGRKVRVRALGFGQTPDLLLAQQFDSDGKVVPVQRHGLHHVAFWIESSTHINDFTKELKRKGYQPSYGPVKHYGGRGGDGGWGGNRAVYLHDPDGHFIEYHNEMDAFGTRYD